MNGKNLELLAPAGSAAALTAAVQSGADAVYLGADMFSARQGADNFTVDEIKKWTDYCHFHNVKVHAAVNTLIKERELPKLIEYAYALNEAGIDAAIIQDMGAAEIFKRTVPELPLHASTQMTVTSLDGVRFLEDMGFERVVLARELTKNEIEYICKNAKAEIEVFVHGALCICYSGQCLMSSVIGGRSGNRGRCAQPCRLSCALKSNDGKIEKKGYMLSPKDLALVNDLSTLKNLGVTSLKIEGRLKRPEYVSAVVGIYRKYLDSDLSVSNADMSELKNAFNRGGFTRAYFGGEIGKGMMCPDKESSAGVFSDEAKKRASENADIRKTAVSVNAHIRIGEPISVTMTDSDNHTVTAYSDSAAERARNTPQDPERIKAQLSKLGGTGLFASSVSVDMDRNASVPISMVNAVRRRAAADMTAARAYREPRRSFSYELNKERVRHKRQPILTAEVRTAVQFRAATESGIEIIYAPKSVIDSVGDIPSGVTVVERLDDVQRDGLQKSSGFDVAVSSPAQIRIYSGRRMYGNFRLNVYNSISAEFYSELESVMLSPELNIHEIKDLTERFGGITEAAVYGRLPLMLMRSCPLKAAGMCRNHKSDAFLEDRRRERFPILCSDSCTAELINSKPMFTADKIADIIESGIDRARMLFTIEDREECLGIIDIYKRALDGEAVKNPFGVNEFTRGHWYRGVY